MGLDQGAIPVSEKSGATCLALALAVLAMGASSPIARAQPRIDLSWDDCSPIVAAKSSATDSSSATLFVSVTGLTETYDAYSVKLWYGTDMQCQATTTSTPDAWRFDDAGCQTRALIQLFYGTSNKSCPPAADPLTALRVESVNHGPLQFDPDTPVGAMHIRAIASFEPRTPDPGTRYLMLGIRFDHTWSTSGAGTPGLTCGGLEVPVCFSLWPGIGHTQGGPGNPYCNDWGRPRSSYYRPDNTEVPIPPGQAYVTYNVSGSFGCFEATPAQATTWGQIKGRYR